MTAERERDPGHWLARLHAGEASALGPLLESHRNYLTLLVRLQVGARLRTKLDVEDVIQETCLAAHRAIGEFQGSTPAEFLAWLRAILRGVLGNQVRRYLGTKGRDIRLEHSIAEDLERSSVWLDRGLVARDASPSDHLSRREQALVLADALAALPEHYREVILLRQFKDLSFGEIADRMGRSVDSVKNVWVRALARLRRVVDTES